MGDIHVLRHACPSGWQRLPQGVVSSLTLGVTKPGTLPAKGILQ